MAEGQSSRERNLASDPSPAPTVEIPSVVVDMDSSSPDDADTHTLDDGQSYRRARTIFHHRRADNDTLNSTRSIYASNVVYTELHGRRYCKDYYMPNDEDEQTRLQMLNGVYYSLFGHRLTTVPLTNPKKILDIGTGTGEWAMAMGDEYPETEVIGTDIAKIQPGAAPLNVFFEIDDAEEEHGWTWADDEFDFIHFRYMCGAFTSWDHIYRQTFKHLKPGGWIEVIDFDDHATLLQYFPSSTSAVPRFLSSIVEGCRLAGRPRTTTHLEPASLAGLGFVDVRCTTYDIPMGVWPDDAQAQKNGKHSLVTMLLGLEAVSLRVLTEQLGWSVDEVRNICDAVTRDVWKIATDADRAHGFGVKLKVLVARKPDAGEGKGEGEGG